MEGLNKMPPGTPVLAFCIGKDLKPPMLFIYSGNYYSLPGSDCFTHVFMTASEAASMYRPLVGEERRNSLELTVYDNGKILNSGARKIKKLLRNRKLPRTKLRTDYPARRQTSIDYGPATLYTGRDAVVRKLAEMLR